jgi:hypothetical protein
MCDAGTFNGGEDVDAVPTHMYSRVSSRKLLTIMQQSSWSSLQQRRYYQ